MIGRLRAMDPRIRRDTLLAAAALVLMRVLLSMLGAARSGRLMLRARNGVDQRRAVSLAEAVARAARHLPLRTNCLDRAYALSWMLGRNGLASEMKIGVRRSGESLAAHAWVEHGGEVLLDDEAAHFAPLEQA